MTTFFVSRHPGAREWAMRQGLRVDIWIDHLDNADQIRSGDTVIGTLPVNLAAVVCARGAAYYHLALELPTTARGRELSVDELEQFGAHLQGYAILPVEALAREKDQ